MMVTTTSSAHPAAAIARRCASAVGLLAVALLMLGAASWGVLALHYWDRANLTLREVLVAVWAAASVALIAGFVWRRWRWRSLIAFAVLFAALLIAWRAITPSNDREWEPENA